jgi:hypothetical protein
MERAIRQLTMENQEESIIFHRTNRIWNEEQIPDDWRKGLLVKLPKKGDLSLCNNWRGITLLSIPSKFLYSVILQRIKTEVGKTLRDEQEGFRQERSCVDQIPYSVSSVEYYRLLLIFHC